MTQLNCILLADTQTRRKRPRDWPWDCWISFTCKAASNSIWTHSASDPRTREWEEAEETSPLLEVLHTARPRKIWSNRICPYFSFSLDKLFYAGVGFDLRGKSGKPFPANFNRHFVSSKPDEDLLFTLMLGPSLIRKPFKLKKLILDKEDEGYSVTAAWKKPLILYVHALGLTETLLFLGSSGSINYVIANWLTQWLLSHTVVTWALRYYTWYR